MKTTSSAYHVFAEPTGGLLAALEVPYILLKEELERNRALWQCQTCKTFVWHEISLSDLPACKDCN